MASAGESDSEGKEFIGFDEEDQLAVVASRQDRIEGIEERDSESDVSVSSVATEDLSDMTDSEEEEELWNENEDPLNIAPFTARAGPMSGVAEDGTAVDFFHLMFPEELIERIISETNRYVCECIATKPDPEWKDRSLEEIKVFLGLHVLLGIKQLPSYKLYWSKDPLIGVPTVQKVMYRKLCPETASKSYHNIFM